MNQTQQFLEKIWPNNGIYFIAVWCPPKGEKRGYFRHFHFPNAQQAAARAIQLSQTEDVFHAFSSYKHESYIGADGKKRYRVTENVFSTKVLVWDVDIGEEEEKHSNQAEAILDLKRFLSETGMPAPSDVVSSGSGLHLYWVFDHEISNRDQWLKLASRLKGLAIRHGGKLAADTTRISDAAGVLRPVGTFNYKKNQRLPVSWLLDKPAVSLSEMVGFLKNVEPAHVSTNSNVKIPDHLMKFTLYGERDQIDIEEYKSVCAQVKRHEEMQGNVTEPDWYAFAQLMTYTQDGRRIFHDVSKGHPKYSFNEADSKFQQVWDQRRGPTLCKNFEQYDPDTCKGCPFYNKFKSPLHVVQAHKKNETVINEQEVTDDEGKTHTAIVPKGYIVSEKGILRMEQNPETGANYYVAVYPHQIYPVSIVYDHFHSQSMVRFSKIITRNGKTKTDFFEVPQSAFSSNKEALSAMAKFGKTTPKLENEVFFSNYVRSGVALLDEVNQTMDVISQFGWVNDNEFAIANRLISDDETKQLVISSAVSEYSHKLSSKQGSIEDWLLVYNAYYNSVNPNDVHKWGPYMFPVLAGFGAPLMKLVGQPALLVSMEGDSGLGKTAVLKLMHSIWGTPSHDAIVPIDTPNAAIRKIETYNNLPISFDEITHMPIDRVKEFALQLTMGRGKQRLRQGGEAGRVPNQWNTIVVSSANRSLLAEMGVYASAANAEMYRVLPVPMPTVNPYQGDKMRKLFLSLEDNHGLAGEIFIKYVIKNRNKVKKRIEDRMSEYFSTTNNTATRFWWAGLACIMEAAEILKELGMSKMKPGLLEMWAKGLIETTEQEVTNSTARPIDIIGRIIVDNPQEFVTVIVHKGNHSDENMLGVGNMRRILGRVERNQDTKQDLIMIRADEIKKAMGKAQIGVDNAMQELHNKGVLLGSIAGDNVVLTKGTKYPQSRVKSYTFDYPKLIDEVQRRSDELTAMKTAQVINHSRMMH